MVARHAGGSPRGLSSAEMLALAEKKHREAEEILAAAQAERDFVINESAKIEEANALIEIAYRELTEAQQAFERKLAGLDRAEASMQTDRNFIGVSSQTTPELIEPLVAERALAVAAEKATEVDSAFQTHGAAWLTDASQTVQWEVRNLLALLSSKMEDGQGHPKAPHPRVAVPAATPGTLQITWRQALNDEIRKALAPLRERIASLNISNTTTVLQFAQSGANERGGVAAANAPVSSRASISRPHSGRYHDGGQAAPPYPSRPTTVGSQGRAGSVVNQPVWDGGREPDVLMPPWLLDSSSQPPAIWPQPHSPREGRVRYRGGSARAARQLAGRPHSPKVDEALPYVGLHDKAPRSGSEASRALIFSQLDKTASREVAAMRDLLRKQQDLLPLMQRKRPPTEAGGVVRW